MRSIKPIRPILDRLAHANRARVGVAQRRYVASDAPTLYTATAITQGPRGGRIDGCEGLRLDYAMPKALGGPGGDCKTNPEELLAAGYSNCFQTAMNLAANSLKIRLPRKMEDCKVKATVKLIGDVREMDKGFKIDLEVSVKGIDQADLEKVVEKTKEICPYYRVTKGNAVTDVKIVSV